VSFKNSAFSVGSAVRGLRTWNADLTDFRGFFWGGSFKNSAVSVGSAVRGLRAWNADLADLMDFRGFFLGETAVHEWDTNKRIKPQARVTLWSVEQPGWRFLSEL